MPTAGADTTVRPRDPRLATQTGLSVKRDITLDYIEGDRMASHTMNSLQVAAHNEAGARVGQVEMSQDAPGYMAQARRVISGFLY